MAFAPSGEYTATTGTSMGGWTDVFQNPEFLSLLAGMGARMGGKGSMAEAIGAPTQQMIQAQAMRGALGEQEKASKEWKEMLLKVLGGFTPTGEPGINTAKVSDKGLVLDIAGPTAPIGAAGAAGLPPGAHPYDFSAGGIAAPTATPTPTRRDMRISDILPFSSALGE